MSGDFLTFRLPMMLVWALIGWAWFSFLSVAFFG